MLKIAKFGGSSLANAQQFRKVRDIVRADESRRVIVVSAPGKRFSGDHKITDLLYLAHAHAKYGVSGESILQMIRDRYAEIAQELNLAADLDAEFARIQSRIRANMLPDELVSRGEYLCAKLMAEVLGYDFLDAADWLRFRYDGTIDAEASGEALRAFFADHPRIVTPGFYGSMPDGKTRLMARGGSDITGALAAALLFALQARLSAQGNVPGSWACLAACAVFAAGFVFSFFPFVGYMRSLRKMRREQEEDPRR